MPDLLTWCNAKNRSNATAQEALNCKIIRDLSRPAYRHVCRAAVSWGLLQVSLDSSPEIGAFYSNLPATLPNRQPREASVREKLIFSWFPNCYYGTASSRI